MNPSLLCPLLAIAFQGEAPMETIPEGYSSGVCHYDGKRAHAYTLVSTGDVKPLIVDRYGDAPGITLGDETIITWSEMDRPRNLAKDGIRMIVLVRHGETTKVHVSALYPPLEGPAS